MMALSVQDAIVRLCREMHVPRVEAVFGARGVDAIFEVMKAARRVYAHMEPERFVGTLIIFHRVEGNAERRGVDARQVLLESLSNSRQTQIVLETDSGGGVYWGPRLDQDGVTELARSAVVYRYSNGREEFLAGTEKMSVFQLDPVACSQFCVPTFQTLRDALECYGVEGVRESTCVILRKIWNDPKRLFLRRKPEAIMRDSLTQFLKSRLGGEYDVMPEQNVDESHPVDIRIVARLANSRLMLVEVKWLGDSIDGDGRITVRYRDARARDGLDQLVDYLEAQRQSTPYRVCQGYCVVIDARRRGLVEGQTMIDAESGLYYEQRELEVTGARHEGRDDVEAPYRMFARPICGP